MRQHEETSMAWLKELGAADKRAVLIEAKSIMEKETGLPLREAVSKALKNRGWQGHKVDHDREKSVTSEIARVIGKESADAVEIWSFQNQRPDVLKAIDDTIEYLQ
jgi:hypothetical protein